MLGRAKVQKNGTRLFIYLPLNQASQEKIEKGSFVDFKIENTGFNPEPPSKRGLSMMGKKEEKPESDPEPAGEE